MIKPGDWLTETRLVSGRRGARVVLRALLLLVCTADLQAALTRPSNSIRTKKTSSAPRWASPCGESQVAFPPRKRASSTDPGVFANHFETIKRSAIDTKEKVSQLEELFVSTTSVEMHTESSRYSQKDLEALLGASTATKGTAI